MTKAIKAFPWGSGHRVRVTLDRDVAVVRVSKRMTYQRDGQDYPWHPGDPDWLPGTFETIKEVRCFPEQVAEIHQDLYDEYCRQPEHSDEVTFTRFKKPKPVKPTAQQSLF